MTESNDFVTRVRTELDKAQERIEEIQQQRADELGDLRGRYQRYIQMIEDISKSPEPGPIREVVEMFDNAEMTKEMGKAGLFGRILFRHTSRYPATATLRFGLTHDMEVRNVVATYDAEVLPLFVEFERHDEVSVPLESFKLEQLDEWIQQKLLGFIRVYTQLQFTEQYLQDSMVMDPVTHNQFPRIYARHEVEEGGKKYFFLTDEAFEMFREDPSQYLGA